MGGQPTASLEPTPEQTRYAGILAKGRYLGLACLFITYALYIFGVLEPRVPLEKISTYLTMSAHDYLIKAEIGDGWSWVPMLGYGDFINFIGIAVLASVTAFCYLGIVPLLLKRKDIIYAVLVLLEVVVLVVAASGLIAAGH